MVKNTVILLFSAFLIGCFSVCAEGEVVLKTDKTTKEAVLVEEDLPDKTATGSGEKDLISTDQVSSERYFKQYVATVNEAVVYIQQGQYEQAVEKLKAAIAIEPNMPYAYDNLANAYYHLHKYEEAIAMSKVALGIDPEYANAYGNLGNAYYALKRYEEAKVNYKKAKELFQKKGDLAGIAKTEKSLEQSSL